MYLFSDPMDPQQRYIDSWDPSTGVTSYGGLDNESFETYSRSAFIFAQKYIENPEMLAENINLFSC